MLGVIMTVSKQSDDVDNNKNSCENNDLTIVGIGASAGGLEALQDFSGMYLKTLGYHMLLFSIFLLIIKV